MVRALIVALLLSASCVIAPAQVLPPLLPTGQILPWVVCTADAKQSYALYLPSGFSPARKWPIVYVFDPAARGALAAEVVRAAAEKFGYIVAASNNSRNGPKGGASEAAQAMYRDTQERFPIDERRRYAAGMSGGARVASGIALRCDACFAGVIANAAGFPEHPLRGNLKFAYFGAVGDADFNYREFVDLRRELDAIGVQYRIRVFNGPHGWAPADVWLEALNWMDIRAMATDALPRDSTRIQAALDETLERARAFEAKNELLAALREYQSAVRDFAGFTDVAAAGVTVAKGRVTKLENDKGVKGAEKRERSEIEEQKHLDSMPSAQMATIATGDLEMTDYGQLRSAFADLKKEAAEWNSHTLVARRALGQLLVDAYESGEASMDAKNYRAALLYFDLAAVASRDPSWAHYQRARAYAMTSSKKDMIAELRLALAGGFHDSSALDAAEFQAYRNQSEFQALAEEWKRKAQP